jgi:hypothetical protein
MITLVCSGFDLPVDVVRVYHTQAGTCRDRARRIPRAGRRRVAAVWKKKKGPPSGSGREVHFLVTKSSGDF